MTKREKAETLLKQIAKEHFHQWYDNDFASYIQDDEDAKTHSEMLDDIEELFAPLLHSR